MTTNTGFAYDNAPANAIDRANTIADLAKGKLNKQAANILRPDGSIYQSERLLSARARYGASVTSQFQQEADMAGDRGQWGYIKLVTTQTQSKQYSSGKTPRQVTFKELIGQGSEVAAMSDPQGSNNFGYDSFLITGVSAQMSEKTQVTEVFGDNEVVYYFGREPIVFNISGILIDSPDNNWFVTWLKMYSDFLRGTQLAKNRELLKLVLPNMVLTGTISSFSWNQDSNRDVDIPFTFQFIAKSIDPMAASPVNMATSNKLSYVNFSQAANFVGQDAINSLKNQTATLSGVLSNPASSLQQKAQAYASLGSNTGGVFGQYKDSSAGKKGDFQATVDKWNASQNSYFNSVQSSAMFQSVTSALSGIRLNLFSPVYGVMSSLTKLVSNVTSNITGLLSSVITPVRQILRDITNLSNQAISLVKLVNSSISGVGRYVNSQLSGTVSDFKTAVKTLGKASGAVASAPLTVSQSLLHMFSNSQLGGDASFLQTKSKMSFTRPVLPSGSHPPVSKASLIVGIKPYSVQNSSL